MASAPSTPTALKPDSFLNYFGSLGRRRKSRIGSEVDELEREGKDALDRRTPIPSIASEPEEFILDELEERAMLEPSSARNHDYQELVKVLTNWINDELFDERIIVKSLTDDLFDGQIVGKLVEKLSGRELDTIEMVENEDSRKFKLRAVLETTNRHLDLQSDQQIPKWTVDGIYDKNPVEIVNLLVALLKHYQAPVRLPENVTVQMVVVQKRDGQLHARLVTETLTGSMDFVTRNETRDAFDTLFEHARDKLEIVKQSLVHFVNRHLNSINIECFSGSSGLDLDPNQFSDGLLLIFLMGSLEGYFVPLGNIYTTPDSDSIAHTSSRRESTISSSNYVNCSSINKLHNVNVAFQLMEDAGIDVQQKVRAEDIVNADLKSVLRVLYTILERYKHL